jgi:GUN4-like/CHAT domain
MKSILLLAANPKGKSNLRLHEEEREISDRLRFEGYGKVPINTAPAARPKDVQRAMLDFDPQIVHFSGHGTGISGLCFEDETGREQLISAEALAELFKIFSKRVECVVLNACYSAEQARAIAQHIDYVVGMDGSIGDQAAIIFSVSFYGAIGSGRAVDMAYDLGCNAIQLETVAGQLAPILFRKGNELPRSYLNQPYPLMPNDSRASDIGDFPISLPEQYDDLRVSFDELVRLLYAKQWQAADQETARLLLLYADADYHCLRVDDIENIPCSVLQEIDRFWRKYSNGRFGFSVQSEIWQQKCGGSIDAETEQSLGSYLGWREAGEWKNYNSIFHLDQSSDGRLPCFFLSDLCWRNDSFLPSFLHRFINCQR